MKPKRDNYQLQAAQAKQLFLTYDQQELICRCRLRFDGQYLYTRLLRRDYRICRFTGHMERKEGTQWRDGNSFAEVMTLLDWLCDSKPDRYIAGRWVNMTNLGKAFHRSLQDELADPYAVLFDRQPEAFRAACLALGGEILPGADIGYAIELLDGLKVFVQLWHGDEEFAPRLRCLWDENTLSYIRYETTWFARGFLLERIKELMI